MEMVECSAKCEHSYTISIHSWFICIYLQNCFIGLSFTPQNQLQFFTQCEVYVYYQVWDIVASGHGKIK